MLTTFLYLYQTPLKGSKANCSDKSFVYLNFVVFNRPENGGVICQGKSAEVQLCNTQVRYVYVYSINEPLILNMSQQYRGTVF